MKPVIGAVLGLSIFAVVALAFDSHYETRLITTATLTIHVKEGQFLTIKNFTQDQDVGNGRGVIDAGVPVPSPTPTPTATATPTPTLSTNAGPGVAISTGTKLNDTAVLFGDVNPTGSITFTLFDPSNLPVYSDVVPVNNNGTYSTASSGNNPGGFQPAITGTYTWTAFYGGDGTNPAAMDNGQNETELVTATPTPTPTAAPTPTPIIAGVLTAALPGEFIKPMIIAGPATLTIDPVSGVTLSITYGKSLQPIQPTSSPTPTP
jgi:hypothetical protein